MAPAVKQPPFHFSGILKSPPMPDEFSLKMNFLISCITLPFPHDGMVLRLRRIRIAFTV
ncbi:hypothetical protein Premu_1201 [Hallella multisaccharivorax DSM 17128]|uniref:Uncharacterized protein n=1 Tax=Hallella multisaccharivorax DSM 17128 TaxID=688246 RepID=F8N952_9BACT|nr:hypothetical protein Premu_1201 [Hallella multisaccharivorax DSM 17128]